MGSATSLPKDCYYSEAGCLSTMAGLGPDPQHPNVDRQKMYQSKAFEHLNRALCVDEAGTDILSKAEAIPHYTAGIAQLEAGVALDLPQDPLDPGLVRAHTLRSKMRNNLATAQERLTYLSTSLHLNTLSLEPEVEEPQPSPTKPSQTKVKFTKTPAGVLPCRPTSLDTTFTVTPKVTATTKPSLPSPSTSAPRYTTKATPSSPTTTPRYNRAAELRKKSNVKPGSGAVTGKGKTGPGTPTRTSKDSDRLKEAAKLIKGCDGKLVEMIMQEVVPKGATGVKFSDISGQDKAKAGLHEMVVLPALRPDLFTGLRAPARGLLLFGPPGNGKTLLARALAAEASSNLINISSSSLTSKWLGEGEKLVKALFGVARHLQPSIIFIDEIDAILSERKSGEHEGVRRIKTEFLLQFEGMLTGQEERVVVVAATNRPQELDDAALRRFTKRVYVEMPDKDTRRALITNLLAKHGDQQLTAKDLDKIVSLTDGYSCSDLTSLARDAALAPVRELDTAQLATVKPQDMRRLGLQDFVRSSERVRKSLSAETLVSYERWNKAYGDIS